jgi:hypothetical protein
MLRLGIGQRYTNLIITSSASNQELSLKTNLLKIVKIKREHDFKIVSRPPYYPFSVKTMKGCLAPESDNQILIHVFLIEFLVEIEHFA